MDSRLEELFSSLQLDIKAMGRPLHLENDPECHQLLLSWNHLEKFQRNIINFAYFYVKTFFVWNHWIFKNTYYIIKYFTRFIFEEHRHLRHMITFDTSFKTFCSILYTTQGLAVLVSFSGIRLPVILSSNLGTKMDV